MVLVRDKPFIDVLLGILERVDVPADTYEGSELEFVRWQLRELGAAPSLQVCGPSLAIYPRS